jgi:hypothetical protein
MNKILHNFLFAFAFFSFSHAYGFVPSDEMVKLYQGRMAMAFGNSCPIEVYIFTDWNSPESLNLDPVLEAMLPEIVKNAKVYFMDKELADSENLSIANLSILAGNPKDFSQYFKIRKALFQLSAKKKNSSVGDIQEALKAININYQPLTKELTDILMKVNKGTNMALEVTQYPTIIIFNNDNSLQKRITTVEEVTQANVMKAIDEVKSDDSIASQDK